MRKIWIVVALAILLLPGVSAYELPSSTVFSTGGRVYSMASDGGSLVLGSGDGYVYYIDPNGNLLWKYSIGNEVYSVYLTSSNVFAGSRDDRLYELTKNGQMVKEWHFEGDVTGVKAVGNTVYITTGFKDRNNVYWGGVYARTLDGKSLWEHSKMERAAFSVDSDGKLTVIGTGWQKDGYHGTIEGYDSNGNVAFSYKTGDWVRNVKLCGNLVLGASYDGNLYALDRSGNLLWEYNAGNPIYSMDCDGNVIVLGTNDGTLHILDLQGRALAKESLGVEPWSLRLAGRYVYVGTGSGNVLRLDREKPVRDELAKVENELSSLESASGFTLTPVRELLNKAKENLNSGKYEIAYDYVQQAMGREEAAKEAWNAIKVAESSGDVSKALQAFKNGDYEEAKRLAEAVLNANPGTTTDGTNPGTASSTTSINSNQANNGREATTIKKTSTQVVVVEENKNYLPYVAGGAVILLLVVALVAVGRSKQKTPSTVSSGADPLKRLFERYTEVEPIGEGGFARVYKAKRKDGKIVALKVPKSVDEETGRAFIREITNWLHLKHPNIVRLYEANVVPVPYIEMEYCESSLEKEKKPMDVEKAAWIIFNTAEGLKYAHSRRIIHRDLKPSNILLKNGVPKISDWGLSKFIGEEKAKTIVFTPYYAAPEQVSPETFGDVDERSDIWQLGVIFYELVTGKRPFEGRSLSSLAQAITTKEPVKPSELNPDAKEVEPIIMKMLAKRKEERYGSVEELQRDLAKVLGIKYQRALERSVSARDFSRSAFYAGELALMHLKLGNLSEALKYLLDLRDQAGENPDLDWLISQVKLAMEEGVKLGEDAVMKADVIIHRIRLGR